jgi:hypothetical protein
MAVERNQWLPFGAVTHSCAAEIPQHIAYFRDAV